MAYTFSKQEDKILSLGLAAINEKFDDGVNQALDSLTEIGTGYLDARNELEAEKMVISIKEIGKAAALQGMENAAVNAIRSLKRCSTGPLSKIRKGQLSGFYFLLAR